jgi:PleD family two-component response regulator
MLCDTERRRVLIAAGPGVDYTLKQLFCKDALDGWETMEADSFSRARFLLQHDPCDLLLVNDDLYEREGSQGLAWLARQRETPLVFLAGSSALHFQKAYELGVHVCLPRHMALEHPSLLATVMNQALKTAEMRLGYQRAKERLSESRQHVDRLVNMIWRTTSRQADVPWFSQRSMLERLQEELARVERHRVPLTLAVGEIQPAHDESAEDPPTMPDWAIALIARSKRRCDVVGQYGVGGFMLLMVQTPIKGGMQCCRRLQKFIEHAREPMPGPHAGLQAYFGVSSTMAGKMTSESLLRAAEQNLEAARVDARERMVAD